MRIVADVDEAGYSKVIRMDDWGYQAYFIKVQESDFGTRGIRDQDPKNRLVAGMKVHVKWDDGSITLEEIVGKPHVESVSDWGHTTQVKSEVLFVQGNLKGNVVRIPLENLRVKIPAMVPEPPPTKTKTKKRKLKKKKGA